jgi:hypothetical protein
MRQDGIGVLIMSGSRRYLLRFLFLFSILHAYVKVHQTRPSHDWPLTPLAV